jgi:GMP synthase PP-ATPase subunit
MASLHFDVDTSPMARTVDSVNGHVNGVTVAVTAMEAAVIAAERKSSQTICENVDNGFYVLVKSQIGQKAVAAYSEMNSKLGILAQILKALDGIKNQMQADYNMICRRYHKLFQSLNNSLETRIRELDRPAMKIAETRKRTGKKRIYSPV